MTDVLTAIPVWLGVLTLPGSLVLALWSIAALLPARRTGTMPAEKGQLAIVVPAHNEEASIASTVRGLRKACKADGYTALWVVADNCTDATALLAARAGAQVLQRNDSSRRGKGHALEFAFSQLANQGVTWFVVVDADSTVEADFLPQMRRAMHADRQALQACYLSRPTHTLRGRLARLAQFGFNLVRPLGRSRLGISVGLLGNGFALRADTTTRVPYTAHSVAEDLEYHLHLAQVRTAVHYVPDARVWGEIAESGTGAPQQRARWEGGRFRMINEWSWPLLAKGLRGQPQLLEPLAELMLLPLGLHVALLCVAAVGLQPLGLLATGTGLVAIALYLLAIALRTPATRTEWATLLLAPAYVAWKLTLLPMTLAKSRRNASWVRADAPPSLIDTCLKRLTAMYTPQHTPLTSQTCTPQHPDWATQGTNQAHHSPVDLSVIVVSFNTRDLLRRSLQAMQAACEGVRHEIIVVDNASHDGSADMVATEFAHVTLVRAHHNLGFAAANNLGRRSAKGEFLALINPDAFPEPGALATAIERLRQRPLVGMVGGLLVGKDGQLEPSARMFPSPLNDFLALSGLSARYATSRFFGRFDRTWADPLVPAEVDWVPGAYCLIRQQALDEIGFFDERFFLYYEEVDLCLRLKQAGYTVAYWPELRATHWGGESSKTVGGQTLNNHGKQLTLWRMRSALLYYRKHHGWLVARVASGMEMTWHTLRQWRNRQQPHKRGESTSTIQTMRQAWAETLGGRVSPYTLVSAMFDLIREDWRTHEGDIWRQGIWVLCVYRFGRWRYKVPGIWRKPLSLVYKLLKITSQVLTGIDLPCEATVGRRLTIEHFGGIVVSGDTVIGDDVVIRNGVTIGLKRKGERGAPVIGNGVDIGSGAKILGAIRIGNGAVIGANAVVLTDVPDHALAVGIPARIVLRASAANGDHHALALA